MAGFGLRKNMAFEWNGAAYRIDRLQPNGELLLEATDSGKLSLVPRQQLLNDYAQGLISAKTTSHAIPPINRPLDAIAGAARAEATRRRRYLEAIVAEGKPVFTSAYLQPIIRKVAADLSDTKMPSVTTVYRWYRRFHCADDARALIPRYDRRGSKTNHQDPRILALLAESIGEAFASSPLATGANIYSRLLSKVEAEQRSGLSSNGIAVPSSRTVYRLLANADLYEMTTLKEGKGSADRRFRITKAGIKTSRILERVEIDHTPLDLFLIDERTWLPLGRPTLTLAIDHFSRMPLGYYLSYGSASTASVIGALRHSILPKKSIEPPSALLAIENQWPTYGIPETLVADNGLEFHGDDLEKLSFDLGISLVFCPKRQPRFKGAIERYLKTINYFFAHQLPGTSFSRFYQRGDYAPQECALLTLSEFKHLFEKWILDVYAQTKHSSLNTTPWKRWQEGMSAYEPRLPTCLETLQQRIGQSAPRKLRRDGFELNGIRYNDHALSPILKRYGEGVEIRVVFDPEDLGKVFVWGPDDADPHAVQALDPGYASGMTLHQNAMIRKQLREEGKNSEDRVALQRARHNITASIAELMVSRKQKARQRSAAIRGISSSKPHGVEQPLVKTAHTKTAGTDKKILLQEPLSECSNAPLAILPAFQLKQSRKT